MGPSNDKSTISRNGSGQRMRFEPPNLNREVPLIHPFKLLEQQKPDVSVIPANVDDNKDELDKSDLREFETCYNDANEVIDVEDVLEEAGISSSAIGTYVPQRKGVVSKMSKVHPLWVSYLFTESNWIESAA